MHTNLSFHLILTTALCWRYHFVDEKTDVGRGKGIRLKSHSKEVAEREFEPRRGEDKMRGLLQSLALSHLPLSSTTNRNLDSLSGSDKWGVLCSLAFPLVKWAAHQVWQFLKEE